MLDSHDSGKREHGLSRRNFLKGAGILAATATLSQLPITGDLELQAATADSIDDLYEISKDCQRFNQKEEAYCRMRWDAAYSQTVKDATQPPNFPVPDVAASSAMWSVSLAFDSDWGYKGGGEGLYSWAPLGVSTFKVPTEPWHAEPQEAAQMVKRFCKDVNILEAGITPSDPRWIYSGWSYRQKRGDGPQEGPIELSDAAEKPEIREDGTRIIPSKMKYVIVMLHSMPYEMVATSPAAINNAGVGFGYSQMAFSTSMVAQFIRGLGYNAIPMGNDTTLSVPLAIAAGLGELGRNGLLVSRFGPRVRITRVLTDLPLAADKPVDLGVRKFCASCKKCAQTCPSGAIPDGEMTNKGYNISNNDGVKKWFVDGEKCYIFWNENGGMCCSNCMATCPYNKPDGYWTHDFGKVMAPILGGTLATIDEWMGYGKQLDPKDYWKKKV